MGYLDDHIDPNAVPLIKHRFGREGAAYIRSYLESNERFGHRLGRLLLDHHDVECGVTWALVPTDVPPEKLADFEEGIFPSAGPPAKVDVGYMVPVFRASSNDAMRAALGALLATPNARRAVLVVEAAYDRRTDDWDQRPERRVFFCGDDVYDFELAQHQDAELTFVPTGATWSPDVGIVTALPAQLESLANGDSVSPAALAEMAGAATAIVVGAWDNEAPLFWEAQS